MKGRAFFHKLIVLIKKPRWTRLVWEKIICAVTQGINVAADNHTWALKGILCHQSQRHNKLYYYIQRGNQNSTKPLKTVKEKDPFADLERPLQNQMFSSYKPQEVFQNRAHVWWSKNRKIKIVSSTTTDILRQQHFAHVIKSNSSRCKNCSHLDLLQDICLYLPAKSHYFIYNEVTSHKYTHTGGTRCK